jgi:glycosyltransferase involved in cell wall biosynthesis
MKIIASDPGVSEIELVIAGSGHARVDLMSQIEEMGLAASVRMVEALFGKEKVRFLQQADVFLFPSYHEGLPYSILESLAAGTPVIASNVGGIPDAVIDGIHGLLIEPRYPVLIADAIRKLASNDDLVRTMSQNCLSWANENYGLQRLSNQFDDLYRSLVEEKHR